MLWIRLDDVNDTFVDVSLTWRHEGCARVGPIHNDVGDRDEKADAWRDKIG